MSGICGLVRLDGAPASVDQLAPVHRALAFRGPDGGGVWAEGPVALGFRLLATTPEAAAERQPWRHAPSDCTIVADARLDNRDDLAAALGIEARGRGDAELILLAYLRWGDEAPLHLLGDYAFAIWDGRRHRLLAVRDPLGMRQLHYAHLPGRLLAFATDDHVLLRHPEVPKRLNEVRIADFVEDLEGADLVSTFFKDVSRLPPAHRLVLDNDQVTTRRYWRLQPGRSFMPAKADEQRERFLELFTKAVSCRILPLGGAQIGAMLSGGLDSSSVVGVAARLRREAGGRALSVFSATGLAEDCRETRMIKLAAGMHHLKPHFSTYEGLERDEAVFSSALDAENPFDNAMSLLQAVYIRARDEGCRVVLDGVGGDTLLGHRSWAARLIRRGKLREAWLECRGERDFYGRGPTAASLYGQALRTALAFSWLKKTKRFVDDRRTSATPSSILHKDFQRRIGFRERLALQRRITPDASAPYSQERAAAIAHNYLVVGRERYDRVAAQFGIEPRDPYEDLRLVHFCVDLPADQLVRRGWTKLILREAMDGYLPDGVRWRPGREHLGREFNERVYAGERAIAWSQAVSRNRPQLQEYLSPETLNMAESRDSPFTPELIRVYALAAWLDHVRFVISS